MRHARFTETQIVAVLKQLKAGAKAAELCRQHGISETTLYNWRVQKCVFVTVCPERS